PAPLDHDAPHLRAGPDGEVRALAAQRAEIGDGGRGAADMALGQLVIAHAVLGLAGHVLIARNAELAGGLEIGLADRQRRRRPADAQRPALAVIAVIIGVVVLGLAEIGQYILIAP